ncbi:MAG TPA: hypothetical protein VGG75_02850 [Trebonia sp.]|jgi:hypothetical protein
MSSSSIPRTRIEYGGWLLGDEPRQVPLAGDPLRLADLAGAYEDDPL